jgi:geranylgeranyl diphosphate synthase type I
VLVAHAYAHAGDAGQKLLLQRLGDPALDEAGINELQQVIVESGAREAVESMINENSERALKALHETEITDEGRAGLTALADAAVRRDF